MTKEEVCRAFQITQDKLDTILRDITLIIDDETGQQIISWNKIKGIKAKILYDINLPFSWY